jgi:tetratricopeptide (TPR) repeat protein
MVYEKAEQPEAAEDAYRKSLAISVQVGALAGQALTLTQLGNVYDVYLGRTEEAAKFLRQAADKFVEIGDVAREGVARNNLAGCLRKLRRLDEAKQEIHRAIECKAQFGHASTPWKAWSLLAAIETDSGNLPAAAQAKQKAIECYLAYRRDGGENHDGPGRLVFAMTEQLAAGGPAAATAFLQQLSAAPDLPAPFRTFIHALQAILNGSRDPALANAPDLNYGMAAEILLLIETLEKPGAA